MVEAKANWLYELPQWDSILSEERRERALQGAEGFRDGFAVRQRRFIPMIPVPAAAE